MHLFLKFILATKLYMFRTVPLSIIRSFSLYTQRWYMSYSFVDSLRAGSGWNILILLRSCQQTCMTYTISVLQWKTPDDGQRNSPKYIEFHCKKKIWEISASIWFYFKKFKTMHGHMNVKRDKLSKKYSYQNVFWNSVKKARKYTQ